MTRFARDPLYRRHWFPVEVIAHAVWLYFRFPLSLRMVEDMLAARGIIVSHQTVRLWAEKFGRHFANDIRKRSAGRLGDKWYLDEVVIPFQGRKHWLWRAVDQDGFVLDVLVQRRRNATSRQAILPDHLDFGALFLRYQYPHETAPQDYAGRYSARLPLFSVAYQNFLLAPTLAPTDFSPSSSTSKRRLASIIHWSAVWNDRPAVSEANRPEPSRPEKPPVRPSFGVSVEPLSRRRTARSPRRG